MNAVLRRKEREVEVASIETTDAKLDALRNSLDEVKKDVRELRTDVGGLQTNVAGVQAMMKTAVWAVGVISALAMVFLTAGKALHWF